MSGNEQIPPNNDSEEEGKKVTRRGTTYYGNEVVKRTKKKVDTEKQAEAEVVEYPPFSTGNILGREEQIAALSKLVNPFTTKFTESIAPQVDKYAYETPEEAAIRLQRERQRWLQQTRENPENQSKLTVPDGSGNKNIAEEEESDNFFSTDASPETEEFPFSTQATSKDETTMDPSYVAQLVRDEVAKALAAAQQDDAVQQLIHAVQAQNQAILTQGATQVQQITDTLKNVQVSSVSSNIEAPKLDMKRMSIKGYLDQVENYFQSMRYDPSLYLTAIRQILPTDAKLWYDHEISNFNSWSDFKKELKKKYDGWQEREARMRTLILKKQQKHEPTEKFIYEVVELSGYCYPRDDESQHTRRAQAALYPHLAVAVGVTAQETVLDLIRACEVATNMILAQDKIFKRECSVPPMRGDNNEANAEKPGKQTRGGTSWGNTSFNPQFQIRGGNRGGQRGGFTPRRQGRGRFNSRGSYTAATGSNQINHEESHQINQRGGGPNRGRRTQYKQGQIADRTKPDGDLVKCMKCQGYGHTSRDCPTKRGISMMVLKNGTKVPVVDESQDEDEDATEPLNM